jgi:YVTN family beta-propeller protein
MRTNCALICAAVVLGFVVAGFLPLADGADDRDRLAVGRQGNGRVLVPTNQFLTPAGKQVTFPGRPVDLALAEGGRTLVVKNMKGLVFIDVAAARVRQNLPLNEVVSPPFNANKDPIAPNGKPPQHKYPAGFSVVGLLVRGERVYASDTYNHVRVARKGPDDTYEWADPVPLLRPAIGGEVFPTGMASLPGDELLVCAPRGNAVQLVSAGSPTQAVAVGVAPYTVCCPRPDRAYVSNWGGDPPRPGQPLAMSSGTPVRIDPRTGVADRGTVSVLAREGDRWVQRQTVRVGLHPSGLAVSPSGRFVYVANANSDTVSVIDTGSDEVVETIPCRPRSRLPFGSGTNAVALAPDGTTLYVANGSNNCIAVVRLGRRVSESGGGAEDSTLAGLIPTAWYPGAVLASADGKTLFVANVKGLGSLSQPRPVAEGKNTHDFLGSVSIIDVPDARRLAAYTELVNANNRLAYSLAGLEEPRPGVAPVPVPERHGEPSVIKHVVYVIKENRSYDQILGDMKEGNGDADLCLFGEEVTPNQHKLAREFTLFDNFYCSGALSATGHEWTDAAYVTDYLEKAFGGFTRSYPVDGDDALAFPSSGFLWDNALAHKRTFRNYGEFTRTRFTPATATWKDLYSDHRNGTRKVGVDVTPNVASMRPYTHPHYPGFPLVTPDAYRADLFVEELAVFERKGEFPELVFVFLPADHSVGTTPGFPTPRAMLADNDRALGRVVEALSKSRFWPRLCVFVVEDDPQFGFDHVDGHRSVLQVISPYTRRRHVDHTNYNQTGVVKTIELILGLPPLNQLDLSATPLRDCFQDQPDVTPYTGAANRVPLDAMNPPLSKLSGQALQWARESSKLDFSREDEADEDTLNRILWHSVRGDAPFPRRLLRPPAGRRD